MSIKTLATRRPGFGLASAFSDFFEPWNEWFPDGHQGRVLTLPKVNVTEDKSSYKLDVAAPGLHKSDFKIDVDNNMLTISGHKEENKEEKEDKYSRQEYNYSSFSRSFSIPEDVQQDKIEASYDGGILKLTLPRNEKTIQRNGTSIAVK